LIVQLSTEQLKMPSSLLDRLQRVSSLAEKDVCEIVTEETEILDKIMPRMFEVMQRIAIFLSDYAKRGSFSRLSLCWNPQMLMIAERTGNGLLDSKEMEMMEEMDGELATVIEDFLRAVDADVEALRLAKRIGRLTLSQYRLSPFSVALCRAKVPVQVSSTYRDQLPSGPPL
jgi:hypothetical protein